jgi:hypothetical protein
VRQLSESDELSAILVPQAIFQGTKAREQIDFLRSPKKLLLAVALLQRVVRNTRTQVVDVMEANVA